MEEEQERQQMLAEEQAKSSDEAKNKTEADGAARTRIVVLQNQAKGAKRKIGCGYAIIGVAGGLFAMLITVIAPLIGAALWILGGFIISGATIKLKTARREAEALQDKLNKQTMDKRDFSTRPQDIQKKYAAMGCCMILGIIFACVLLIVIIIMAPLLVFS